MTHVTSYPSHPPPVPYPLPVPLPPRHTEHSQVYMHAIENRSAPTRPDVLHSTRVAGGRQTAAGGTRPCGHAQFEPSGQACPPVSPSLRVAPRARPSDTFFSCGNGWPHSSPGFVPSRHQDRCGHLRCIRLSGNGGCTTRVVTRSQPGQLGPGTARDSQTDSPSSGDLGL